MEVRDILKAETKTTTEQGLVIVITPLDTISIALQNKKSNT